MSHAEEARAGMVAAAEAMGAVTQTVAQLYYQVDAAETTAMIAVMGTVSEERAQSVAAMLRLEIEALHQKFEVASSEYLEIGLQFR